MSKHKPILRIDKRRAEDIKKSIKEISAEYVPQWQFNEEDPDIGTAMGLVFASEMEQNIDRYNQAIHKYHTEFVNMLDISLLPAKPSRSIVVLNTPQTSLPGRNVKKGTKFVGSDSENEDEYVIFETDYDIYVSSSVISDVFMTDRDTGGIIPLKGDFKKQEILPSSFFEEDYEAEQDEDKLEVFSESMALLAGLTEALKGIEDTEPASGSPIQEIEERLTPFRLFAGGVGIEENAVLFTHKTMFDVLDNDIFVRIKGSRELVADIEKGLFKFLYPTSTALTEFDEVKLLEDGETFKLKRLKEEKKTGTEDDEASLIVLKASGHVLKNYHVDSINFSAAGKSLPARSVSTESMDLNPADFTPFTDTLSLFQECYIGHDEYFSKVGSRIKLEFDVSYFEHSVTLTAQEQEAELKIIKRMPRNTASDTIAQAHAQEIALEYFNGTGWKRLPLKGGEYRFMFAEDKKGHYRIAFNCPDDWQPTSQGAYDGRCLRMVLLKSDNCYLRPCIHHYPRITNLNISFSFRNNFINANKTQAISGTNRIDLTKAAKRNQGYDAFFPSIYGDDALYIGVSKRLEEGPVGILFLIEDNIRYEDIPITFEYSTSRGFKRLRVVDNTEDLSRSGTVVFMPPSDMMPLRLEDKNLYWIRIKKRKSGAAPGKALLPIIKDIKLNAVMVSNINTLAEESYYLEEVMPFPKFALGASNILDAKVWVNEMGRHPRENMKQMLLEDRDDIRAEYNTQGDISAFFVLWKEVDSLDQGEDKRVYLLDRMNNVISFGDGVHTDIPRVTDEVAFKVTVRTCSGKKGNVLPYTIMESMQDLSYVDVSGNPVHAYGGSNIEDIDSALLRGANILSARRRLVSARDYVNEILAFSDSIAKASCVTGQLVDGGSDPDAMSFVVLLTDHESGFFAFHDIARKLENHLITRCECTVERDHMHIIEPVFVEISVDIWAYSPDMEDSFTLQERLNEVMDRFLDPVNAFGGRGHDIGTLPPASQILLQMNIFKENISILNRMITAKYTDTTGTHEADYLSFTPTPFMVCKSGKHRIHLTLDRG